MMLKPVAMPDLHQRTRGTYTSRIKIPRDVAADYARTFGQGWSVKTSWKGLTEAQAREKHAQWVNMIQARFTALRAARNGQQRTLDHRELHALAGLWYVEYMDQYESQPAPVESYDGELSAFEDDEDLSGAGFATEAKADAWLLDHGHALTPESREAFLDVVRPLYVEALTTLAKRAQGDYSRDPIRDTFPTLQRHEDAVSLTALWDQWVTEKQPAHGTVRRWKAVIAAANAHWPDMRKVTEADARTWLKSLVTFERSAFTVATIWRTALKTICNWAMDEGKLASNPFARVKIAVPRKNETRDSKAFTDDEVRTILTAAFRYQGSDKHHDAKRWLPFLMFYSGCRVGEAAQLRGQDIVERDGAWAMTFTYTKTHRARTVPIHSDLIAQGFLDFARSRGAGPLFYNGSEDRAQIDDVGQNVGEWVRSLGVNDPEIRPSHAWRHLFKLAAERAGIPERISDVITGHKAASVGRAYGAPLLSDLAREIEKLPCYKVE